MFFESNMIGLWFFLESDQKEQEEEDSDPPVVATNFFRIIENSIMTFYLFLKMDKKKSGSALNFFGVHGQDESPLQQTLTSLDKVWYDLSFWLFVTQARNLIDATLNTFQLCYCLTIVLNMEKIHSPSLTIFSWPL